MTSWSFSFMVIWHIECRTLTGISLPTIGIFYSELFEIVLKLSSFLLLSEKVWIYYTPSFSQV